MRPAPTSTPELRRALCVTMALGACAAGIVACSSPPKPPPPKPPLLLAIHIVAGAQLNPDARMRPSPVVVRVYELKSLAAFNGADFFALYEKEQETLGADLIGREEYHLRPGETRPYQRQLQPDTKFIGVVAAFRDIETARWRQTAVVPAKRRPTLTVGVQAQAVTVVIQ
jgi:type VI secretion system protein VasD